METAVSVHTEQAAQLVQLVGGLPLAIQLMGQYLCRESYGQQPKHIAQAWTRLFDLETGFTLNQPQSPLAKHPSLSHEEPLSLTRLIRLSEAVLSLAAQNAFLALRCLPPKPTTFSLSMAMVVNEDQDQSEPIYELVDHGLIEPSTHGRFTIHQTILRLPTNENGRSASQFALSGACLCFVW